MNIFHTVARYCRYRSTEYESRESNRWAAGQRYWMTRKRKANEKWLAEQRYWTGEG